MDTQSIINFIEVCNNGSFSKAARKLYITPQGLSKSIKSLEEELGIVLFYRNSKGISLTEKGKVFLEASGELYDNLNKLEHIFEGDIDSTRGKINISSSLGILRSLTPEYLLSFNTFFPNVELTIKEKTDINVDKDIENKNADIGLVKLPVNLKGVRIYPIDTKEHCALIFKGHPLYEKDEISVADLQNEKIIIESNEFKVHKKFVDLCRKEGFEPEIYFETTEISMAHYLAHLKKGIAVTVASEEERIGFDNLKMVKFKEEFLCEWAAVTSDSPSSLTSELLKFLGLKNNIKTGL